MGGRVGRQGGRVGLVLAIAAGLGCEGGGDDIAAYETDDQAPRRGHMEAPAQRGSAPTVPAGRPSAGGAAAAAASAPVAAGTPAAASTPAPAGTPAPAAPTIVRAEKVDVDRVVAGVIYAKEVKCTGGVVGALHESAEETRWKEADEADKVEGRELRADVLYVKELACVYLEAREVHAKEIKLGKD